MNWQTLIRRLAPLIGIVLAISVTGPAIAKTQVGLLECDTSIGIGEILTRKQTMTCTFKRNDGTVEKYTGTIREFGLEVGVTEQGRLAWAVFAATPTTGTGLLAGKYAGVTASVAAGIGLGADVLVGGTGDALSLQPIAVEGAPGIGLTAGVERLELVASK